MLLKYRKGANIMANKIKVKLILELKAANMSRNLIAKTRHMAKNSVSDVIHIAEKLGIIFEDVKDKSEEEVYRMFYPDKFAVEVFLFLNEFIN